MRGAGSPVLAGVYGPHGPPDERAARPRARSRKAGRRGAADGAAVTTRVREIRRAGGSPLPPGRLAAVTAVGSSAAGSDYESWLVIGAR